MKTAKTITVRTAVVFICLLLALALAPVRTIEAIIPTVEIIYSEATTTAPIIDGNFPAGEWTNAQILIYDPIHTYVYFKNSNEFLYVCVDAANLALADLTEDADDHCTLYFDTDNDESWTAGHEDVFKISGNGETEHFVAQYYGGGWGWESHCSPFAHTGLEAAAGFGASPHTSTPHRIYEFQIPLSLIGAYPGDTIGFASPGPPTNDPPPTPPCIPYDASSGFYNVWPPGALWDDMSTWADLVLAKLPVEMWTYPTEHDITDIAVGELNGDDNEDVVAIDGLPINWTLHVLRGEGDGLGDGDLLWEKSMDGFSVAVGDIDGDGINEVIAAGIDSESNSGIFAYEDNGTLKWFYPIADWVTDIEIGDIDGNGVDDVVACDSVTTGAVYAINGTDGSDITGWPKIEPGERFLDIAVGQLDGEGGEDVAAIGMGGTGALHGYYTFGSWAASIQGRTVEIGDVNGDGSNEVVAGTVDGWVHVFSGTGIPVLYSYNVLNPVTDVELGDLDGNPENGVEVACMTTETIDTLYALDIDDVGNEMMWWYFMAWDSEYYGECIAIGDVDRDYKNEVVACSSILYHYVYAFDGLDSNGDGVGDLVWPPYKIKCDGDGPRITDLEIGDLDGDGDKDVVFGTTSCSEAMVYAIANLESKTTTATGSGEAYFDSDPSTLGNLTPIDESTLPEEGKPNYNYPHGFFSFTITGLTPGQQAIVTVTLPGPVAIGTKWVKCHDGVYYVLPIGDDDGDNVITIVLTDGVVGEDDDETINGIIIDDGGPGYPKAVPSPPPPPPPSGPVGIHVAQVDKFGLLAPWLILAALILCGGMIIIRRRAHR